MNVDDKNSKYIVILSEDLELQIGDYNKYEDNNGRYVAKQVKGKLLRKTWRKR